MPIPQLGGTEFACRGRQFHRRKAVLKVRGTPNSQGPTGHPRGSGLPRRTVFPGSAFPQGAVARHLRAAQVRNRTTHNDIRKNAGGYLGPRWIVRATDNRRNPCARPAGSGACCGVFVAGESCTKAWLALQEAEGKGLGFSAVVRFVEYPSSTLGFGRVWRSSGFRAPQANTRIKANSFPGSVRIPARCTNKPPSDRKDSGPRVPG